MAEFDFLSTGECLKKSDIMAMFEEGENPPIPTPTTKVSVAEYNKVVIKFNSIADYVEKQESAIERITRDYESQLNIIRRERDHALSDAARARQVLHDCEHHTADVAKENQALKYQAEQCIRSIEAYHAETAKIFAQLKLLQEERDHYVEQWKIGLEDNLRLIAENQRHLTHITQLAEIKRLQVLWIEDQTRQIETMTAQLGIVVNERDTLTHGIYREQEEYRAALDNKIDDYQSHPRAIVAWSRPRQTSSVIGTSPQVRDSVQPPTPPISRSTSLSSVSSTASIGTSPETPRVVNMSPMGRYLATMVPTTNGYDRATLVSAIAETEYNRSGATNISSGDIMPTMARQHSTACAAEKARIMQDIASQTEINHYDTLFNLAASLSVQLSDNVARSDTERNMYERRITELNTYVAELRLQINALRQENLEQYHRLVKYDRKEFDIRKTVGFKEDEK